VACRDSQCLKCSPRAANTGEATSPLIRERRRRLCGGVDLVRK
jgi:hypothetical protein